MDSYLTLVQIDTRLQDRIDYDIWDALTPTEQQEVVNEAMYNIESLGAYYFGIKTDDTQDLEFPRDFQSMIYISKVLNANNNIVPELVNKALCEEVIAIAKKLSSVIAQNSEIATTIDGREVSRVRMGLQEIEFEESITKSSEMQNISQKFSLQGYLYLKPFLTIDYSGSLPIMRV